MDPWVSCMLLPYPALLYPSLPAYSFPFLVWLCDLLAFMRATHRSSLPSSGTMCRIIIVEWAPKPTLIIKAPMLVLCFGARPHVVWFEELSAFVQLVDAF